VLLFALSGLACDVFNGYALPCVYHNALREASNLRRVKSAKKIVVDFKLLRLVLAYALRLMDYNPFHKLMPGNPLFELVFTVPEENDAESVFGVVDGTNPRAAGMAGIGKNVTVLFMLTDSAQSKVIHTKNKHYFALSDESGHVRFFTNT